MAKPTVYPEWATGETGIAETTEPSAGKKADGWADGELPPHETFNWLGNTTHEWIKYFDNEGSSFVDVIPAAGIFAHGGDGSFSGSSWDSLTGDAYSLYVPLKHVVGQQIDAITIHVLEGSNSGEEIDADVFTLDIATAATSAAVGGQKLSGITGAVASFGWTSGDTDWPIDVVAGENNYLRINLPTTIGSGDIRILGVTVSYNRP
jgi:hypothetical protein